jgi:hypothetical protein
MKISVPILRALIARSHLAFFQLLRQLLLAHLSLLARFLMNPKLLRQRDPLFFLQVL